MAESDRRWLTITFALYGALALAWFSLARWTVPPLLLAEKPSAALAAFRHHVDGLPAPFLVRGTLSRWREITAAVLMATGLHLTIVLFLRRYVLAARARGDAAAVRTCRRENLGLAVVALVFLAVTVVTGPLHDYYLYLQMWYEVRQGHDPWFIVYGLNGEVPLNAYGPLFNLLAPLAWLNPLAPKLLFAYTYILFAITQIKSLARNNHRSRATSIALAALFWNPFPWIEIAVRGHFDILVAISCLYAVLAQSRGRNVRSGLGLGLGVLLKYYPVVLLPFLALDRGRLRSRFLIAAVGSIALGLALGFYMWGVSMTYPLTFAATRRSTTMSIFAFLRGRYSPLQSLSFVIHIDRYAPLVLGLALLRAWAWYRTRRPDLETAATVAVVTTVLFYQTGYPQYQMVPFVIGAHWAKSHWHILRTRIVPIVGVASYFGWLAAFEVYYLFVVDEQNTHYWQVARELVGLPSFLFECAFLAAVVWSASQQTGPGEGPQSSSSSDETS
jgi:hypothetical protein